MSKKKGRVLMFYGSGVQECVMYLVLLRYARKSNPRPGRQPSKQRNLDDKVSTQTDDCCSVCIKGGLKPP